MVADQNKPSAMSESSKTKTPDALIRSILPAGAKTIIQTGANDVVADGNPGPCKNSGRRSVEITDVLQADIKIFATSTALPFLLVQDRSPSRPKSHGPV